MRRLFLFGSFIFSLTCAALPAQSCKDEVIDFTAKITADPESVPVLLGDAIRLNPDCIGDLFEAAVVVTKPDDDTLTQLIKMVVSRYPWESATIAEAAVIASPDQVDVIRSAFVVKEKVIVATPVEIPIEELLLAYQTSRPFDPKDVADKALLAIDQLLGKVSRKEGGQTTGSEKIFDTLTPEAVEEIKLSMADTLVNISTLGNMCRDLTEELLPVAEVGLIIQDPVVESPEKSLAKTVEKVNQKAAVAPKVAKPRESITSSVYHIPSSKEAKPSPKKAVDPAVQSQSVSPTSPR